MKINTPTSTVLYSIEQSIKAYRRLCTINITKVIPDITVDQALILLLLDKNRTLNQIQIGNLVFKDYASITRIIKLMIQKGYIEKEPNIQDKRSSKIKITSKGSKAIKKLAPIIKINRETALKDISIEELNQLYITLNKITNNCNI